MPTLRDFLTDLRARLRKGELWERWFLALVVITLIGIFSQPLANSRRTDVPLGFDPYDIHPIPSEREADGHKERGL